jgi:hypothetical protein
MLMRRPPIRVQNVAFRFSPLRAPTAEFLAVSREVFGKNRGETNLGSFLKKVFGGRRVMNRRGLGLIIDCAWLPRRLTHQVFRISRRRISHGSSGVQRPA